MLELKGISRVYKPKKSEPVYALNKVDLVLEKTGMVFILGKSGAGKSTFLNVVGGLDQYNEGNLIVKDKATKDFKQSDFDSYRNTMIGFIFQEYNLLDEFTVAQNIGLAMELQGKKATSEKINEILAAVDLQNYGRRKPNELSVGQKQRVAIARALVKDPEIIMADEPTGALDSVTGKQVLETLEKLSKSRLVIVVSHDREFAETYASRIIEFKDGYIISDVTKETVAEKDDDSLVIGDEAIEIKQGYTLTDEDVRIINDYLKSTEKTAKIRKKSKSTLFAPTNHEKLDQSVEPYHPIKSKLPFKSSLKIGASSLRHKTVRLIFAIILSAISFAMFGLADTMSSYNKYTATTQSIIDTNVNYVSLTKTKAVTYDDWVNYTQMSHSNNDLIVLDELYPELDFKPVYSSRGFEYNYEQNLYDDLSYEEMLFYSPKYSGLSELSADDITSYGMTLLGNSRIPLSDSEVVITKYSYDIFERQSFKDSTNLKVTIQDYNDLIGKKITFNDSSQFTIVGIVDTAFDTERFEPLKEIQNGENILNYLLMNELNTILTYSQHNLLYVNQGYFDRNIKENGVYMYEMNGSMILIGDVSREYTAYPEYVNKFTNYVDEDITYLKDMNETTLQEHDVFVSETLLASLRSDIFNDYQTALNAHIDNFVATIDLGIIEQGLKLLPDYTNITAHDTWTPEETEAYRQTFAYIYYSEYSPQHSYGKNYQILSQEVKIPFFTNLEAFTITQTYYSWPSYQETPDQELRVVGIVTNEEVSNQKINVLVLPDAYYDSFNFGEAGLYTSVISPIDVSNRSLVKRIVNNHYANTDIVYQYQNEITITLGQINEIVEGLANVFMYIGIVFAIFSALLLLNYITTSVSYKKKEIGILRAIGARGIDVVGIFTKEAMIISLINFMIALILVVGTIIFINYQFRFNYGILITILTFSLRQFFLMLAISVFVGLVSSAIPVARIARKRPIDAIRDR